MFCCTLLPKTKTTVCRLPQSPRVISGNRVISHTTVNNSSKVGTMQADGTTRIQDQDP